MHVLITGITGFVGSHLAEYLLCKEPSFEIYGTVRWRSRRENIEHIERQLELIECDLSDAVSVRKMMEQVRPDIIFHMAARSFVLTSWHAPADTLSINILSQVNILESVRSLNLNPVIQIAGSSEEYGMAYESELPIKETNPLRPLSPYGVSKVAQDLLGYQYYMSYKMRIVRTRAFNHSGPRRGEVFVESNFSKQIVEIEKGYRDPVIMVGNLEAKRDFTDVRDVVQAYHLAVEKGEPGEVYNIASGKSYSVGRILEILLENSPVKIRVEQDPARMRPSDVPHLLGDSGKFRRLTGWEPTIPLEKTLDDILQYWRERL